MQELTFPVTYLLFRFVEVLHKVICRLPHVLLYFNRLHPWQDKCHKQKREDGQWHTQGVGNRGSIERWYSSRMCYCGGPKPTSRSSIVLKNALFVSTYCFGCQAIPALSVRSEKERPAPEASLSTFQRPPPHQVTPADQWGLSPSCRHPRLSPATGRMGTWKQRGHRASLYSKTFFKAIYYASTRRRRGTSVPISWWSVLSEHRW